MPHHIPHLTLPCLPALFLLMASPQSCLRHSILTDRRLIRLKAAAIIILFVGQTGRALVGVRTSFQVANFVGSYFTNSANTDRPIRVIVLCAWNGQPRSQRCYLRRARGLFAFQLNVASRSPLAHTVTRSPTITSRPKMRASWSLAV